MTWTKNDNEFMLEIKSQFGSNGSTGTVGHDGSGQRQVKEGWMFIVSIDLNEINLEQKRGSAK